MKKMIRVVAAIIEDEDKILVAKRNYGEFENLWEFPGGKYEEGESGEQALIREIKEEFESDISIKEYLCTVEYEYETFYLVMDCYICSLKANNLHLHSHSEIRWIKPNEDDINWVPADRIVIENYRKRIQ